ncbi:MAG TPA: toll/interleukin-1 receptor domain-containing protein [Candidatus Angelobacter sp.]
MSHSSADIAAARKIYHQLSAEAGIEPWLDEESLIPGQSWREEIPKAVNSADVFLVCVSNSSVTKEGYLQREIRYALDAAEEKPEGTIFIIPLKLEECEIPARLRGWQWANLFQENGYARLMQALKLRTGALSPNELGIPTATPAPPEPAPRRGGEPKTPATLPQPRVEISDPAPPSLTKPLSLKTEVEAAEQIHALEPSNGEKPKKANFAELIGARSERLSWPIASVLAIARVAQASTVMAGITIISHFALAPHYAVFALLMSPVFALAVVVSFRTVRSGTGALLLATVSYSLIRGVGYLMLFPSSSTRLVFGNTMIDTCLFLTGIYVCVRLIRPLSLGLLLGSITALTVANAMDRALAYFTYGFVPTYLSPDLIAQLCGAVIFSIIFSMGLHFLRKLRSKTLAKPLGR